MDHFLRSGIVVPAIVTIVVLPLYAWLLVKYNHRSVHDLKSKTIRLSAGTLLGALSLGAYYYIKCRCVPIESITRVVLIFLYSVVVLDIWILIFRHRNSSPGDRRLTENTAKH